MKIIVTGGAGFIGGNFIHYMLNKYNDYKIICLDALTYAGNLETLEPVKNNPDFKFYKADIADRTAVYEIFEKEKPDIIVNFAAESHDLFFTENTPLHTSSPYSASKASADLLVQAYHRTFKLPVTISRCSNNYGPYHFPEKLIPLMIINALKNCRYMAKVKISATGFMWKTTVQLLI